VRRVPIGGRPDWRRIADENGFAFHTLDGEVYWDESAYYAFSLREIEEGLEAPTAELEGLCREFVGRAVNDESVLRRLAIPEHAWFVVRESWRRGHPSLYGRFDFAFDGRGPAKLLEYNADTPTALYETGVFQWLWLEDNLARGRLPAGTDQFNSVHERLIARLGEIGGGSGQPFYFTCMSDAPEDRGTVAYLEDCSIQAGQEPRFIPLELVGLDGQGRFVDQINRPIDRLFKLYPYEWLFHDAFGRKIGGSTTLFVEPPWKALLSNKGLLPYLWQMAPNHPNLLPAYFEGDPRAAELGTSFARKPLYSREGANVTLVREGGVLAQDAGPYGGEGFIRQGLANLYREGTRHAVIGSWVVGQEPAGICLRESDGPITTNRSRFLPHAIVG
jgi:glutathionylspermidine synthase